MNRCVISLVALAACDPRTGEVAVAAPSTAPVTKLAERIAKGVPHGAPIMQVAVTEQADAALTFDLVSSMRLWPTLDGSRPPVEVSASAPVELALAHAGTELLAVIRDDSSGVTLLRLGRDGAVHARTQLPGELGYEQAIAFDGGVLARTPDQAIEWYTADGTLRGRIVADQGQRIDALATRHGGAAALVRDGAVTQLRWLALGEHLAWSVTQRLPATRGSAFAISPDHHRIAVVDDKTATVMVYELGLQPTAVIHATRSSDATALGFIDNDRAVAIGSRLDWHVVPPEGDAWANTVAMSAPPQVTGGAVGDGVAVTGIFDALALSDKAGTRYLGYTAAGAGVMSAVGDEVLVGFTGTHFGWLDGNLTMKREIELQTSERRFVTAFPLDNDHLIQETNTGSDYHLAIIDSAKHELRVGDFAVPEQVAYFPDLRVLAVATRDKPVRRFEIDLAKQHITELPPLDVRFKGTFVALHLLDPERAGGIVAVSLGWPSDYAEHTRLDTYRMEHGALVKQSRSFDGQLVRVDPDGTQYTFERRELVVRRGDTKVATVKLAKMSNANISLDREGTRFVVLEGRDVVMRDDRGAEKWRTPVWGAAQVLFAPDDKRVLVRATGGFVALDATSGARAAMECGWGFGLSKTVPMFRSANAAPVCEDPALP